MSKTTPLRLDDDLLRLAKQKGARTNRSAAAQIERWAQIGRVLEKDLTDAQLEAIAVGLAEVRVVDAEAPPAPELDDVLAELGAARTSGTLTDLVAGPVRYRAAADSAIERVTPQGVERGRFIDGTFVADPRERTPSPGGRPPSRTQ